jgi:hypothetical protein
VGSVAESAGRTPWTWTFWAVPSGVGDGWG